MQKYESIYHLSAYPLNNECGLFATGLGIFPASTRTFTRESVAIVWDDVTQTYREDLLPFHSDRLLTQTVFQSQGAVYLAAIHTPVNEGVDTFFEIVRVGCDGDQSVIIQPVHFPVRRFVLQRGERNQFVAPALESTKLLLLRSQDGRATFVVYDGIRLVIYEADLNAGSVTESVQELGALVGEIVSKEVRQ